MVKIEPPKSNQEHDKACNCKYCQPTNNLKDTLNKWMHDPNGWIAVCTISLVFIGIYAL